MPFDSFYRFVGPNELIISSDAPTQQLKIEGRRHFYIFELQL